MNSNKKIITILVCFIALLSILTTFTGIFSNQGEGVYEYKSIRGENIIIYGKGIYRHMSAEVAIQGIAQDFITLFVGVPLLFLSLYLTRQNSLRGKFILAGTVGYFHVTYLFYLLMAMYNELFIAYVLLMGASFFALALILLSFQGNELSFSFHPKTPAKFAGIFLVVAAILIYFLWLGIIIPPLLDGAIYPKAVEHYTTLIVQGMDLGLLLPLSIISGILLYHKKNYGYLLGTIYSVFLSLLMTALVSKIVFMGINGYNIVPVIFIIPTLNIISIICSVLLIKNVKGLDGVKA